MEEDVDKRGLGLVQLIRPIIQLAVWDKGREYIQKPHVYIVILDTYLRKYKRKSKV